ncbi:MAG: PAS domain-containing protein [Nitrospirae bacterium]|nr:MAG: PAS domain-containing protein [Nitrospirota bacterium]
MESPDNLMILLGITFPLVLLIFFFLLVKSLKRTKENRGERRSETAFVVETFHELVGQLKEKERELDELRLKAEARADEIESFSRNIIQSVPSGVVSLDEQLRVTFANASAIEILKIGEDVEGKSYEEIFDEPLREILFKRRVVKREELLYTLKGGEKIWLGLTTSELFDTRGKPIGMVIVFSDITEFKAMETQIQYRKWLSSLGEISLGIAHELRNPLGVISGYVKMLAKKDEKFTQEVDAINREIKIMDRIIQNFLSFARPVTPAPVEIDLDRLVDDLLEGFDLGGIAVSKNLVPVRVKTDEVLLRQALGNLIQNSIEAMREGGMLKISVGVQAERLFIEVEDSGGGIPERISEKVFLPFFTTKEKGTGLGLSIVQKNITLLGGSVNYFPTDKGTRFVIELPFK